MVRTVSGASDSLAAVLVVVGAAIVRDRRVLAARRSAPAAHAGGWEFPGGKVEPGESPEAALARECREELGVQITVGEQLGAQTALAEQLGDIGPGFALYVYVAELTVCSPEPRPLDAHDALRWLSAAELHDVAWLPADRPLLPAVRDLLL